MDDTDRQFLNNRPTPRRPLLGLTILVVEDSRYACEAMRLLCLRSGARIRRADCLRSARRHLQVYRPSVAIVDLGLPDGSGAELIAELDEASPRVEVILGTSGDDFAEDVAIAAGADGFLPKPQQSLAAFQQTVIAHLPEERRPAGIRHVSDETVDPDPLAYIDDMAHIANLLGDGMDASMVRYVTQFVGSIARCAGDPALGDAADQLVEISRKGQPVQPAIARLGGIIQSRLTERMAM